MSMVRQPIAIGPTTHWSEIPLVRRPIALALPLVRKPIALVRRLIGPKKCQWHCHAIWHWSENHWHWSENHWHWSEKACHWPENPLVWKSVIANDIGRKYRLPCDVKIWHLYRWRWKIGFLIPIKLVLKLVYPPSQSVRLRASALQWRSERSIANGSMITRWCSLIYCERQYDHSLITTYCERQYDHSLM